MNIPTEFIAQLSKRESENLEYKAVLPPSKVIAQLISSFANSNGGYIILGVRDTGNIVGLSEDFQANSIVHKALDLLEPKPNIYYQYFTHQNKKLYGIKVEKSESIVTIEGKTFKRVGEFTKQLNPPEIKFKTKGYDRIKVINKQLESYLPNSTNSKIKFVEHYQSILKIMDDLSTILYPHNETTPTTNLEGKLLCKILFSSLVDNFEVYLSDLLYEIFLAIPDTLKSQQSVTIEEVLNCSDLQEFVKYWAKQKILKLQRGSVKGFIKDNKQISDLNIIDDAMQNEIEKNLQIRHLYSHRNGIVDEKFLQYFETSALNSEHQLSIHEICNRLCYLVDVVNKIDIEAITKYNLSVSS